MVSRKKTPTIQEIWLPTNRKNNPCQKVSGLEWIENEEKLDRILKHQFTDRYGN